MDPIKRGFTPPQGMPPQRMEKPQAHAVEAPSAAPQRPEAPPPPDVRPAESISSPERLSEVLGSVTERIAQGTEAPPFSPSIRAGALATVNDDARLRGPRPEGPPPEQGLGRIPSRGAEHASESGLAHRATPARFAPPPPPPPAEAPPLEADEAEELEETPAETETSASPETSTSPETSATAETSATTATSASTDLPSSAETSGVTTSTFETQPQLAGSDILQLIEASEHPPTDPIPAAEALEAPPAEDPLQSTGLMI